MVEDNLIASEEERTRIQIIHITQDEPENQQRSPPPGPCAQLCVLSWGLAQRTGSANSSAEAPLPEPDCRAAVGVQFLVDAAEDAEGGSLVDEAGNDRRLDRLTANWRVGRTVRVPEGQSGVWFAGSGRGTISGVLWFLPALKVFIFQSLVLRFHICWVAK